MSVGRESIRRAANAGAGKTVKKPVDDYVVYLMPTDYRLSAR